MRFLVRAALRFTSTLLVGSCIRAAPGFSQEIPETLRLPEDLEAVLDRSNREIQAGRAALAAAQARLSAAGFAPPAALRGEAEEIPDGADVSRAGSLRLELEREVLSGGRRDALRAVATAEVEIASATSYVVERRIRAGAARFLTGAVDWSAIERRLSEEDSLLSSAEESIRARFSVGEARYVDVLRLRTERLRVQTERATAGAERRIGRYALLSLLAADRAESRSVEGRVDALIRERAVRTSPPLAPAADLDSLISASGVLRAAEAALSRARAARALAMAELRPRLSGFLGVQRFRSDHGGFTAGLALGGSVSLPFTASRATSLGTIAAEMDLQAAEAERTATLASLRVDLATARERYEVARSKLAGYDAALLAGAREERESALAAYRAGELSLPDLLDFERALARAETDRFRSHLEAVDALADIVAGAPGTEAGPRRGRLPMLSSGGEK